jgi:hypothetical protein
MAIYAVLNGNNVENIIVADSLEIAETVTKKTCIEYDDSNPAGIGWSYDGTKFIAPTTESNTDTIE